MCKIEKGDCPDSLYKASIIMTVTKKNPIFKWAVFKSIFLQRKHTTGHQIDAKIFKITNHQGNADHNEILPHRCKDVCYQKDKIKNAGKVVEKRKPLYNVGGNINWYSVQFSSVALSCPTLCDPMERSTPGLLSITNSWSPPKPMSIKSVMPSNHLILCHPLLLLPSIFPSIRVFSNESVLHIRWPKYWSFSFNISPSNEHPGLTEHQMNTQPSFRMDWLDLLAVQGTLKSILQHHSSKASILLCSAFFIVQISHPYMTTGKTIALTRWTFVDNIMSLLFIMLSRLTITFFPRSKCLLIS